MRHWPALALLGLYLGCVLLAPAGALPDLPPHAPLLAPSFRHPLGTDDLGRDLLAAVLQGGRTSVWVAGLSTLTALALGLLVGLIAGLAPGAMDEALMRGAEVVASLPTLLLAVLVAALFGGSTMGLALVIGLTRWPLAARIMRIETRALRESAHVRAAFALGVPRARVARRHLFPALRAPLGAAAGILFGGAIVTEASLAFLGLGDPGATSWGQMVASGFALLGLGWWLWAAPVAVLALASGLAALAATDRAPHAPHD